MSRLDTQIAKASANLVNIATSAIVANNFQRSLNWFLEIVRALILDSRVEAGIRSLAAAPLGPETRPLDSLSAASIISRSPGALPFVCCDACGRDGARNGSFDSQA